MAITFFSWQVGRFCTNEHVCLNMDCVLLDINNWLSVSTSDNWYFTLYVLHIHITKFFE